MEKIIPFSIDAVRDLCSAQPTRDLEACSICSRIPESVSRFEKGGEVKHDDNRGR